MSTGIRFLAVVVFGAVTVPGLCRGDWLKVDDFQAEAASARLAKENQLTHMGDRVPQDNGWIVDRSTTALLDDVPGQPGNRALRVEHGAQAKSHDIVYHRGVLRIAPGKTGTVFLRFMIPDSGAQDGGAAEVAASLAVSETMLHAGCTFGGVSVRGAKTVTVAGLADGGRKSLAIKRRQWYKLWVVVENAAGEGGGGHAYLQEDATGALRQEVPGFVLKRVPRGYRTLSVFGVVKAAQGRHTDLWADDLYIDNTGANASDPLAGGAVMAASASRLSLTLTVPLRPAAGREIAGVAESLDALGKTDLYQGMWPTDPGMPIPQFPCFHVEPILATNRGVTLSKEYPMDRYLTAKLPALSLAIAEGGQALPFYSGTDKAQLAYRTGNLLKLIDGSGPTPRSLELAVVSHRLVLLRVRIAQGAPLKLVAEWAALGEEGGKRGDVRVIANTLGLHALASFSGKDAGETLLAALYEIPSATELEVELDEARKLASDFDGLWQRLAKPHAVEPFLTGGETPLERNLIAVCLNRVLRNQRQAGAIAAPSGLEFYGPEWHTAAATWICFQPACRYNLWIEPVFWRDSLHTLFDNQADDGRVPQAVWPAGGMKISQIPNLSPCVRDYYAFTHDRAFLEYVYPRLKAWYDWWLRERNPGGDGIIAVGASKLGLWDAICEYKDNHTDPGDPEKFANTCNPLTRTEEFAGRPDRVYLPDIVACQARMAEDLAFMAKELGDAEGARRFAAEYDRVREWANKTLWDEETKFYYPVSRATGKKLMKRSNVAFWLLWAGIPSRQQAAALIEAMFDPQQFFTPIPLPMIALNDPTFNPKCSHWGDGYVWPIDVSHAFDGLLRYGEWDKAARLAERFNGGVFASIRDSFLPSEYYHHSGRAVGNPIIGTAGCLPLTFQRYLKDYKEGRAQAEWARFAPPPLCSQSE